MTKAELKALERWISDLAWEVAKTERDLGSGSDVPERRAMRLRRVLAERPSLAEDAGPGWDA